MFEQKSTEARDSVSAACDIDGGPGPSSDALIQIGIS
jgi:hypothetical protein